MNLDDSQIVNDNSQQQSPNTSSQGEIHSKSWSANSVQELSFVNLGSKRLSHGSRGGASDPEGFSVSHREINVEDARLVYVNDALKTNERFEFAGNSIRTAKYSVFSFLPRNLFEQFHRVAYIYFLIIAILNQLPQLAVFGRGASILPLSIVLLVTAIKDAYEDWRRHRSDRIENNRMSSVLVNDRFEQKKCKDIQVGEIIKFSADDTIPSDIVLLSTSDPTGVAYIQTINLDGESNLKTRYAKQETLSRTPEKDRINGVIKCEKPNRNIYGFHATMEIDGKRLSLGPSNIVLRGCVLKNTNWAIGVVVYAGRETKAMLNSSGAPSKRSRLETRMNREIILLSIFLVALCTAVSVCAGVWLIRYENDLEILQFYRLKDYSEPQVKNYNYSGLGVEVFFTFLMSVIVFQIMIPISLYISMELVRVGQAYFMIRDDKMYDESSNSRFQCRALNINEDLGQIKYVFSDKTGTLTENKMEFKHASIFGVDYSGEKTDSDGYFIQVNEQIWRPKMKLVDYQGESPDEQALVYAAAAYGFMLMERTSGHIVIDIQGERQRFNVLGMHEFDSDRKRMSVILGYPNGTVKVIVKGADTSMFTIIDNSFSLDITRATESHLQAYSSIGLRTLVVGIRELSVPEFQHWQSAYETASTAVNGRVALLRKVAVSLENNLEIVGASAIEDRLQTGVPEAIESLRKADIKVWVLTGDKQETAISIGYSSRLLTSNMSQIVINCNSKISCGKSLEDGLITCKNFVVSDDLTSIALVIDGTSLVYILDTELEEKLFQLASNCAVVVCCRVAPLQKAGIVALIKNRTDDMTLAIGDGANDVSMIQMADVGIGISGQEGRQAVMASDFAMGQFRFLVPLLLVHGHWNYQRMGYMILYNFYRNAVFVLVLFWYVLFTGFTLTTAITEWSSVLYSVLYTSLPTIVIAILDKDLSRRSLLKYPQLYGAGQRHERYNARLFWLTIADTFWQSIVVFYVPLFAYWKTDIDGSSVGDLWTLAVVFLVNIHLGMDVIRWSWVSHVSIWGSIFVTCVCVIAIDVIPVLPGYWAIFDLASKGSFWICLLGIQIAAIVPRFGIKMFMQHCNPSDIQIAREAEKFGNLIESTNQEIEMNTTRR
ncbi:unnamed protein product [Lactuca saligna]|uniref:Phospholipid-transporting ATPase n=1 Tax=Lactuca saligna TaxID=75948 RepID=A0AA36E6R5_LACSI|nr:unnamed protein product [Lactuca saligna]